MKTSDSGGTEGVSRWLAHMEEAGDVVVLNNNNKVYLYSAKYDREVLTHFFL